MARQALDYYPTPEWCYEELPINWKLFKSAHEPCSGDGRIVCFLESRGIPTTWSEISEGKNFLEWTGHTDLIIGNPPYSKAQEFVEHSLVRANTVIMLLRLAFLSSKKRYPFNTINQITALYTLASRPRFINGKSDYSDYGWFVWDKTNRTSIGFNWIG